MDPKFLKPYNPNDTEEKIYKRSEESGFFNPDACIKAGVTDANAKAFSIVLPPPNVTGVLHMGHALTTTLEDSMVRFARLRGKKTLWVPGTDHAAIATQSKVEKEIYKKEGKNRYEMGREELLKRIEAFAKESHDTIVTQVKALGASLDWSREAFTLDEARSVAVRTAFKKMYEDGIIYRGFRIINWDPKGQTTISDDEIVYEERQAKLYTFKYSKDFPIAVATTRPETKLGDTAVAVHPDDMRYKNFVGKTYEADFAGEHISIKIVADKEVDPEFGTGAVGVTPAHSQTDADIASRHNLPSKPVIDERAKMMVGAEGIKGKKVTEAREVIVAWLKAEGLLEKEEDITQSVATAERTGGIIEPMPKLQWFVNVNKPFTLAHSSIKGIESGSEVSLKDLMRTAVKNGGIKIIPEHFDKTYFHWIENLRDWCISRQIWYGHRIPVWYKNAGQKNEELYVGIEAPKGDDWEQDPDTLDTWFSSSLWTFSTLGWPNETADLTTYHPTTILETGYDILFFWVSRMVLMSGYLLGDVPFKNVYLHGIIRDAKGRKMSKSLGNGIDPIEMAKKYGADALRLSLIIGNTPGTDMRISEDKIRGYKHFANKIWNITRFILENSQDTSYDANFKAYTPADEELLKEWQTILAEITKEMEEYKFYLSAEKLYHYAWHRLADVILEESKKIFMSGETGAVTSRKQLLQKILRHILISLHPFMPFVTEEIWSSLPDTKNLLMVERWPALAAPKP